MNLVEFLQELSIKGWHIWSEGSQLRYDAPEGAHGDNRNQAQRLKPV